MRIFLKLIVLLLPVALFSQDEISIQAVYNGHVALRWTPSEKIFRTMVDKGVKVERVTLMKNGVLQNQTQIEKSKVIIMTGNGLRSPIGKSVQVLNILNHNVGEGTSTERTLSDAVDFADNKSSQYLYSMMIIENDWPTAVNMGFAIGDRSVSKTEMYGYTVSVIGTNYSATTTIELASGNSNLKKPRITDVTGMGDYLQASLSWNFENQADHYSSYYIYRGTTPDTAKMTLLNPNNPFIPITADESMHMAIYNDSLPNNSTTYHYAIKGYSPFNAYSPFSNIVSLKGQPMPLDFELKVDSIVNTSGGIKLLWSISNPSVVSSLSGFNIYRLKTINGESEQMNNSPIGNTVREYEITNALSSAYYYITAIDVNGREYKSIAVLGQPADATPPAKPVGLKGIISRTGELLIEWSPNSEADLAGYLVLYSNEVDGQYTQLTNDVHKTTKYASKIDVSFNVEYMYVRVIAVDHRYNRSIMSDALSLERPDISAPMAPIITILNATQQGIRVGWQLSKERDIASVTLQRRRAKQGTWGTIANINFKQEITPLTPLPNEEFEVYHIDSLNLEKLTYEYRITSTDRSGNQSTSLVKSVKAYDDGIRGDIGLFGVSHEMQYLRYINLEGNVMDVGDGPFTIATVGAGASGSGSTTVGGSSTTSVSSITGLANRSPRLTWVYDTGYPTTLVQFKIYRKSPQFITANSSQNTSGYVLVKTITPERAKKNADFFMVSQYVWVDRLAQPIKGHKYTYKIIAEHSDSGTSTWSKEVEISL